MLKECRLRILIESIYLKLIFRREDFYIKWMGFFFVNFEKNFLMRVIKVLFCRYGLIFLFFLRDIRGNNNI